MKNNSAIKAKIIFKDGNKTILPGNKFAADDDIYLQVYKLRKYALKNLHLISEITFFDNRIIEGCKEIFYYCSKQTFPQRNDLAGYLGNNYSPKFN